MGGCSNKNGLISKLCSSLCLTESRRHPGSSMVRRFQTFRLNVLGTEDSKITSPRSWSKWEELGLNSDLHNPSWDSKLCESLLTPSCPLGLLTPHHHPTQAPPPLGELSYLEMWVHSIDPPRIPELAQGPRQQRRGTGVRIIEEP